MTLKVFYILRKYFLCLLKIKISSSLIDFKLYVYVQQVFSVSCKYLHAVEIFVTHSLQNIISMSHWFWTHVLIVPYAVSRLSYLLGHSVIV